MGHLKEIESAAFEYYKNGNAQTRKMLLDIFKGSILSPDIKDRVKTYEDACIELHIDPLKSEPDFTNTPYEDANAVNAYYRLCIIARALNEGWKPDWSDSDERKYFPWFDSFRSGSGFVYSGTHTRYTATLVGSRLCFKSQELAEYAGKQFIGLYNIFFGAV